MSVLEMLKIVKSGKKILFQIRCILSIFFLFQLHELQLTGRKDDCWAQVHLEKCTFVMMKIQGENLLWSKYKSLQKLLRYPKLVTGFFLLFFFFSCTFLSLPFSYFSLSLSLSLFLLLLYSSLSLSLSFYSFYTLLSLSLSIFIHLKS